MRRILLALLALSWMACYAGVAVPPDSPSPSLEVATTDPIFPHKSTWADPKEHGLTVKIAFNFDTRYCTSCHGQNLEGGSGPSCHSCHSVFPHDSLGVAVADHGTYVLENGAATCATQCHGTDLKGGLSGTSCTQCHKVYPHPSDWRDPQNHGMQALGDLKDNCKPCHGDDLLGGISHISCQQCHKIYPHPANWGIGTQHGATVAQEGTAACATQCHGVLLKGYPAEVPATQKIIPGCNDCHIALPHAPLGQWDHGRAKLTEQGIMDVNACTTCHNADLTGNGQIPSCYQCHRAYPDLHRTADWGELSGHGTKVINEGTGACTICHGADLSEGAAKTSCSSCHTEYPHADTWKDTHGQTIHTNASAAAQSVSQYVQKNCTQACHSFTTTTNAPACASCHDPQNRYPHSDGWDQEHGLTVVAAAPLGTPGAAALAGCLTACHGSTGNNGFLDAPDQCTTCHSHYPHAADWKGPTGAGYSLHGLAVIDTKGTTTKDDDTFDVTDSTKFGECAKCHGDAVTFTDLSWSDMPKLIDLPNGAQVPRCTYCHDYPHVSYEKWGGAQPWSYYHDTVLNTWYYSEHVDAQTFAGTLLDYAQQKCGTSGGCHTDGPHNHDIGSPMTGCNFCHTPP